MAEPVTRKVLFVILDVEQRKPALPLNGMLGQKLGQHPLAGGAGFGRHLAVFDHERAPVWQGQDIHD
ncbi:MAG: hypothetical protein BGO92_03300 [Magnetospirillum sp. 64-120]|nr:MAG: hypothetical protein BGO92_03300 [Magnetospirillum sp. 64-120]